jgi:hypothetical protein
VQLRWDAFLEADRASRPGAFAAYAAAVTASLDEPLGEERSRQLEREALHPLRSLGDGRRLAA